MRSGPDNYFVRLDSPAPITESSSGRGRSAIARGDLGFDDDGHGGRPRRRRRRSSGRPVLLLLLAAALIGWFVWASERPGGVSGTINGFIEHVRGDVQSVSGGTDLKHAAQYMNAQYQQNGAYPQLSDDKLTAAGISIDVDVQLCENGQGVVLRTVTVSRLLVAGVDHGEIAGRQNCPADLRDLRPWRK